MEVEIKIVLEVPYTISEPLLLHQLPGVSDESHLLLYRDLKENLMDVQQRCL